MKKLIIKFSGGFGNQLFQYSVAKNFELNKKFKIIPDFNFFRNYKLHKNYIQKIGFKEESLKFYLSSSFFPDRSLPYTKYYLEFFNFCKFIKEKENMEYIHLENHDLNNLYLDGYWQNLNYFSDKTKIIKKNITKFLYKYKKKKSHIFDQTHKNNFVMIHFRLKDYKNKENINKHGLLKKNYYLKAINLINTFKKKNKYIIFTDELDIAKKKFSFLKNKIFFDKKFVSDPITTMYYMTICDDFIISNSTFSWWAAYLSKNQNKIVICPNKWFVSNKYKRISYEKKWIKI